MLVSLELNQTEELARTHQLTEEHVIYSPRRLKATQVNSTQFLNRQSNGEAGSQFSAMRIFSGAAIYRLSCGENSVFQARWKIAQTCCQQWVRWMPVVE